MNTTGICKCGNPLRKTGYGYCLQCHAAYQRGYRKAHPKSAAGDVKKQARGIIKMALKRGSIKKEPCVICKSTVKLEAHHSDYAKPYKIDWLCRIHHIALHNGKLTEEEKKKLK